MIFGIFLIIAGIMIALYPPLLSIIVATILLMAGITITSISYRYKKMRKHFDNPFMDFFTRF
jgi:Flp pilus assembly protein TadB